MTIAQCLVPPSQGHKPWLFSQPEKGKTMIVSNETPRRLRVVQADAYPEDFEGFPMPRPFTEENCLEAAKSVGANAAGLANQMNQVLAENLGNLLAARIKKAVKDGADLPSLNDFEEMVAAYDFSGVRVSSGTTEESMTPFERVLYAYARKFIRALLKKSGLPSRGLKAPVTIPKSREADPGPGQISYDDFEELVTDLAEGNGMWGESEKHITKRAQIVELAEAEYAAKKAAAGKAEDTLGL